MSREKQIEEMVAVVRNNTECCQTCTWHKKGLCMEDCELEEDNQKICTDLYNAGYRKIPTTDWLTKGISEEQIKKEKQEAADVVSKNEYEIAIREVGRLSQEVLLNCEITEFEVKEAKAKLSREIFKEIEEILRQHTEGGYYLNGAWFPERLDLYTGDAIAELKKKYMEGENES